MAGRREWIPCASWAIGVNILPGVDSPFCLYGEDEMYLPYAADEATFLRLKGHIIVTGGDRGIVGWRVRMGLDELGGGGVTTAGPLSDMEVAEEHFLDERYWFSDGGDGPNLLSHPYWCTFNTASKRKMKSPDSLVISFLNETAQALTVTPFIRGLFLFP